MEVMNHYGRNQKIPERAELAQQDKWAIEDIYATDELWEADLEKARGYIPKIAAFAGHLGESAQMLLAYAQMERRSRSLRATSRITPCAARMRMCALPSIRR